ncbi:kinase [Metabacillus dongyingensis]|uniref:GHMP family kinase ATP-binding protein n=1 Tax=Metabacillus dongyingensis TaxID=2874282 RepID=UPI003B8BBE3B
MQVGRGRCNGTFGELVQGVLCERPFLITLPIPILRSNAVFIPHNKKGDITGPLSNTKAVEACKKVFQRFDLKGGGHLKVNSNIPRGKGLASSSADVVAAMKAVADSYSLPLSEEIISRISSEIEPTDGVMYKEVVAYDYIHGQLIERFGSLPSFVLIGMDLGGTINTLEFNRQPKRYSMEDQAVFLKAYHLAKLGMEIQDLSFVCQAATLSACINQKISPKRYFSEFKSIASKYDGGLIVAHSGTVLGVLLNPSIENIGGIAETIYKHILHLSNQPNMKPFYYFHRSD